MKIVIDGNDGTGKSTLVKELKKLGHDACDRGIPTKMTDDFSLKLAEDEFYVILDASIAICQQRLQKAGKSLEEQYHNKKDLEKYRKRFEQIAKKFTNCVLINANCSIEEVVQKTLEHLKKIT